MSSKQPRNMAASIKQRLYNVAKERGDDFNFLITRYAVERLLYRLSQSKYADDFVLKGAMLFHFGAGILPHRPTLDVDLMGRGSSEPTRLKRIFQELCEVEVAEDGLVFPKKNVQAGRIREGQDYEGVRLRLEAQMGSALIPFQVDVGFGDASTPLPQKKNLTTILEFPAPHLLIYPWETVIAEKFQALVDLGINNTRMKDFFDLHYLAMTLAIDGETFASAIQATFRRRATPLPEMVPVGLSPSFCEDPTKQIQWRAFITRMRIDASKESLVKAIGKLREFLMPPVEALAQKKSFKKKWKLGGPWK